MRNADVFLFLHIILWNPKVCARWFFWESQPLCLTVLLAMFIQYRKFAYRFGPLQSNARIPKSKSGITNQFLKRSVEWAEKDWTSGEFILSINPRERIIISLFSVGICKQHKWKRPSKRPEEHTIKNKHEGR
jgi:hypothetical protein